MDGLDVIRQVRLLNYMFPIIVLSDKANELDKVTALDAGAADFVEKPFGVGSCWRGFARRCVALHLLPRGMTSLLSVWEGYR
jgi:DNA-binding NtrC family response regulator